MSCGRGVVAPHSIGALLYVSLRGVRAGGNGQRKEERRGERREEWTEERGKGRGMERGKRREEERGNGERKEEREYLLARRGGGNNWMDWGRVGGYVEQYLRVRRSIAGTARD